MLFLLLLLQYKKYIQCPEVELEVYWVELYTLQFLKMWILGKIKKGLEICQDLSYVILSGKKMNLTLLSPHWVGTMGKRRPFLWSLLHGAWLDDFIAVQRNLPVMKEMFMMGRFTRPQEKWGRVRRRLGRNEWGMNEGNTIASLVEMNANIITFTLTLPTHTHTQTIIQVPHPCGSVVNCRPHWDIPAEVCSDLASEQRQHVSNVFRTFITCLGRGSWCFPPIHSWWQYAGSCYQWRQFAHQGWSTTLWPYLPGESW